MKVKKIIALILCFVMVLSLTSCNDNEEKKEEAENGIQGLQNIEKATKEEEKITDKKGKEEKILNEQNPPKVSSNWADLEYGFENASYKLPFTIDALKDSGWKADFSETEVNQYTLLEAGEKVAGNIALKNDNYDDKLQVKVGFKNDQEERINILEADVWSFECSIIYGFKKLNKYPVMVIGDGITWGAKKEEIEEKFGKPTRTYEAKEHKYVKYTYKKDNKNMDLIIYEEEGLTGISLRCF